MHGAARIGDETPIHRWQQSFLQFLRDLAACFVLFNRRCTQQLPFIAVVASFSDDPPPAFTCSWIYTSYNYAASRKEGKKRQHLVQESKHWRLSLSSTFEHRIIFSLFRCVNVSYLPLAETIDLFLCCPARRTTALEHTSLLPRYFWSTVLHCTVDVWHTYRLSLSTTAPALFVLRHVRRQESVHRKWIVPHMVACTWGIRYCQPRL
jgi:hypothetical protein